MNEQNNIENQINEWQGKLNFFKEKEAQIVDLEQQFVARKKIKEAEQRIKDLVESQSLGSLEQTSSGGNSIKNYIGGSDIKTLHQALDLFIQQKDKLDHKTTMNEFEELEKIRTDIFDKVFGEYSDKISSIPVLKNKSVISLFERIFTSEKFSTPFVDEINKIRKDSDNYQFYDRSIIVSALTLSVLSWNTFDQRKIDILIDFLTDFEDEVWQRALTGIILSILIHQNRLQRFPKLIKRLQSLQELENIQIGIYFIDNILRNQLFKFVVFPSELKKDDFLNETPYNWFFPFYKDNKILSDAIDKTEQDLEVDKFLEFIYNVPLVGAFKYLLCNALKENRIKLIERSDDEVDKDSVRIQRLKMAYYLDPFYNIIAELFLYYKHYPKERIKKLFDSKITLAQTKLKNIILSKTQALKLAADLHFEQKEFNLCIQKLKELLNIEPNQLSALLQISECYENKEEFSEALTYRFQIEKFKKDDFSNLYIIGYCLNRKNQFKKSNEYLFRANEIECKDIAVLNLIGNNYFELKKYAQSIEFNKKVLELDDKNNLALREIRNCYSKLNKSYDALKYSTQLYELDSEDPTNIINLALDYSEVNDFPQAITLAERAYILESNDPNMVFNYGRTLFITGDFTKAKIILNKVLYLNKATEFIGVTYGNLGHIYLFENDLDKSMEYYHKCVLEFEDVKEFEEKFDTDLQYALQQNIPEDQYQKIKLELVIYWQENK